LHSTSSHIRTSCRQDYKHPLAIQRTPHLLCIVDDILVMESLQIRREGNQPNRFIPQASINGYGRCGKVLTNHVCMHLL
ncbi:hypothetical protein P3389_33060, partial [Vibrio parahaemolyticus]|nr:hypothetical protein [Vibrio parahaemolyticus]